MKIRVAVFFFLSVQTESDKSMYISETHSYIG